MCECESACVRGHGVEMTKSKRDVLERGRRNVSNRAVTEADGGEGLQRQGCGAHTHAVHHQLQQLILLRTPTDTPA